MPISDAQKTAMDQASKAAEICKARAAECDGLGLMNLAREWDYFSKSLVLNIERQRAVLEAENVRSEST